jgi:hypothetical protein
MNPARLVRATGALLALAAPAGLEEIAFRVAADTTLVRTLENAYALELEEMVLSVNGEEVPADAFGEVDIRVAHSETFVVTDAYEAVAGGRPERLRRTFEELGREERSTFSSDAGDGNDDTDYESELEGKTVVFSWNEESERFDAAFADGEEGDEALLAELEEDMDLRRLLPAGALAEDESWSIDPAAFDCILAPGGDLGLEDTDVEAEDASSLDDDLRANLAGTFTATYEGVREEGSARVAVIRLEIDARTHAEEDLAEDEIPEGARGTGRIELGFVLAGELCWDLEHGHALSLELSGEHRLTTVETIAGEFEGESLEQSQTMVLSGEATFSMQIARR